VRRIKHARPIGRRSYTKALPGSRSTLDYSSDTRCSSSSRTRSVNGLASSAKALVHFSRARSDVMVHFGSRVRQFNRPTSDLITRNLYVRGGSAETSASGNRAPCLSRFSLSSPILSLSLSSLCRFLLFACNLREARARRPLFLSLSLSLSLSRSRLSRLLQLWIIKQCAQRATRSRVEPRDRRRNYTA